MFLSVDFGAQITHVILFLRSRELALRQQIGEIVLFDQVPMPILPERS